MTIATDLARVPPSTLGIRLQQAREWRGMLQADIADALDVSRATVSNYERGISNPSRLQINAWAAACDVDVEWLKTGTVYVGDGGGNYGENRIDNLRPVVTLHAAA